jgi:hypothetical protein
MIAKVRRRKISSVRVLINRLQLFFEPAGTTPAGSGCPAADVMCDWDVTACFTCFIRLRSGIANSHQNKSFQDRSRRLDAITMQLWQPHGGSAFARDVASGTPVASAATEPRTGT